MLSRRRFCVDIKKDEKFDGIRAAKLFFMEHFKWVDHDVIYDDL